MKKQSLFYGLIFLALSSVGQKSHTMDWAGQMAATGFNLSIKALDYVLPAAIPAYLVYTDRQDFVAKARPVQPETAAFVREQLIAGYPELKDKRIEVIKITNSCFAAAVYNNTLYISVPEHMNDQEIAQALELKKQNTQKYNEQELSEKSEKNKLPLQAFIAKAKNAGYAMDASTLATWQGAILHEGSHLLHKDSCTRIAVLGASVLVALYATEKLKNYFDIHALASDPTIMDTVLEGLGHIPSLLGKISITALFNASWTYWQEYRADQDSIKRTQDPNILNARSEYFESLPEHGNSIAHTIDHIMDPHPSHKARATYFAQAAKKLEAEKQA